MVVAPFSTVTHLPPRLHNTTASSEPTPVGSSSSEDARVASMIDEDGCLFYLDYRSRQPSSHPTLTHHTHSPLHPITLFLNHLGQCPRLKLKSLSAYHRRSLTSSTKRPLRTVDPNKEYLRSYDSEYVVIMMSALSRLQTDRRRWLATG